jgi:hypothetical protein
VTPSGGGEKEEAERGGPGLLAAKVPSPTPIGATQEGDERNARGKVVLVDRSKRKKDGVGFLEENKFIIFTIGFELVVKPLLIYII